MRMMVSIENNNYQVWQAELLIHSFRKVGQSGEITLLVASKPNQGLPRFDPNVEVVRTRWSSIHPVTKDNYSPYNKPISWCEYFSQVSGRDGETLLLCDPDMLFVKSFEYTGDHNIGEDIFYMEPSKSPSLETIKRFCTRNNDKVQGCGFPIIINERDLRLITDRWYTLTEKMRRDPWSLSQLNWVCEMHAYVIAAAEAGIEFKIERHASFCADSMYDREMIHFCYPVTSDTGFKFDKRQYKPWNTLPPLIGNVGEAGRVFYNLLGEYQKLKNSR